MLSHISSQLSPSPQISRNTFFVELFPELRSGSIPSMLRILAALSQPPCSGSASSVSLLSFETHLGEHDLLGKLLDSPITGEMEVPEWGVEYFSMWPFPDQVFREA